MAGWVEAGEAAELAGRVGECATWGELYDLFNELHLPSANYAPGLEPEHGPGRWWVSGRGGEPVGEASRGLLVVVALVEVAAKRRYRAAHDWLRAHGKSIPAGLPEMLRCPVCGALVEHFDGDSRLHCREHKDVGLAEAAELAGK